jgi:hypothetical protein
MNNATRDRATLERMKERERIKDFCEKHGLREHFIEKDLERMVNAAITDERNACAKLNAQIAARREEIYRKNDPWKICPRCGTRLYDLVLTIKELREQLRNRTK